MTTSAHLALDVADATTWFKSSYSNDNGGGGCISIAVLTSQVGVRDSKQANGPAFVVPAAAWSAFVDMVR